MTTRVKRSAKPAGMEVQPCPMRSEPEGGTGLGEVQLMPMRGTRRRPMTPTRRARLFDTHAGVCGWCHERIEDGEAWEITYM